MIAVVTTISPKANRPTFSLRPYLVTKDELVKEPVVIYSLSKCYRRFFPTVLNHLTKKHPQLIYSEELGVEDTHLSQQLFPKLQEIFTLTDQGTPRKFAILCTRGEKRLNELLNRISPFARSVSLVSDHPSCFEKISKEALHEYGLTVNQRDITHLDGTALTLLLSGEFPLSRLRHGYLINLTPKKVSAAVPVLCDITAKETTQFLIRHPNLRLKHFQILPESAKITNLVWMYC